jgi:ribosomal protein L29
MKRTALTELRAKSTDDLAKMAADLRDQVFRNRMTATIEGKSQTSKVRQNKRQIARLETLIAEAKRGVKPAANPGAPAKATKPAAKSKPTAKADKPAAKADTKVKA